MLKRRCPIWETVATIDEKNKKSIKVTSDRAGGAYHYYSVINFKVLSEQEKVLLTDWLQEQRQEGIECPYINHDTIEEIKNRPSVEVVERANRLLKFIKEHAPNLSDKVTISSSRKNQTLEWECCSKQVQLQRMM